MRRHLVVLIVALTFIFTMSSASATMLWFEPSNQLYNLGDTLSIGLYADIDEWDAIWAFSFDLSFDNGRTFVSDPGASGSSLTFAGFTPNRSLFPMTPFWAGDEDGIVGEANFGDEVSGSNVLLGTFTFLAPSLGPIYTETIYLGPEAGDFGIFAVEGLINGIAFMPNNPTATLSPYSVAVPEPGTLILLGSALIGLAARRRIFRKS